MKGLICLLTMGLFGLFSCFNEKGVKEVNSSMAKIESIYDFKLRQLNSQDSINLLDYKGKYILLVNVASKCGYTNQYEDLEALYNNYKEKLVVIGLPCNQFLNQEPGEESEVASFCQKNYGVSFPMTEKIKVKGTQQHELYQWLTKKDNNGIGNYKVSWNFNKFLISPDGKLLEHFGSKIKPLDSQITIFLK